MVFETLIVTTYNLLISSAMCAVADKITGKVVNDITNKARDTYKKYMHDNNAESSTQNKEYEDFTIIHKEDFLLDNDSIIIQDTTNFNGITMVKLGDIANNEYDYSKNSDFIVPV